MESRKIKADELLDDSDTSQFEYLSAKVEVLQEELCLVIQILKQNKLVHTVIEEPESDIEDTVWKRLEKK